MHTGKDGMFSQRSVLGSFGYIGHMVMSTYGCYIRPDLIPEILLINAGLVAGMLAIKTWQHNKEYAIDKQNADN
jgi:hypothetical protein